MRFICTNHHRRAWSLASHARVTSRASPVRHLATLRLFSVCFVCCICSPTLMFTQARVAAAAANVRANEAIGIYFTLLKFGFIITYNIISCVTAGLLPEVRSINLNSAIRFVMVTVCVALILAQSATRARVASISASAISS